jgi:hypothetical protein
MGFTKHTGKDQSIKDAEIVKPDTITEAKKQSKTAATSLIDEVNRVEEDEEEGSTS